MKTTTLAIGVSLTLACALFGAYRLGWFAPSLAQVEGRPIKETPLVDLAGNHHSFRELRGHTATLYFWGTWCGPCLQHLANLAKTDDPAALRNVQPVAFDTDPGEVRATLQRIGYRGPMWIATDGMPLLQRRFAGNRMRAVPYQVTLDAEGRISAGTYGG